MTESKYTGLGGFSNGLAPVAHYGKWGYINASGEEVILCQFEYVEGFNKYGYAIVQDEAGRYGVIDRSGNYVIQPKYEAIRMINNSPLVYAYTYLNMSRTSRPKAINPNSGKILGEFVSVGGLASHGNKGCVAVENDDGRWGLINEDGDLTLPFQYDSIGCDNYGRCENNITGDYFVTESGGKLTKQSYDEVCYCGGKYGLITPDGQVALDFKYDELYYHSDSCIIVGKGKNYETRRFGVITLAGKTLLPCKYSWIYVGDGIICLQDYYTGAWGWADLSGKILAEPRFYKDCFCGFSEGLMKVYNRDFKNQGKAGYVNKQGELVIPFKFFSRYDPPAWIGDFHGGLAGYAISNTKRGWIDKSGDIVIPPIYDTVYTGFGEDGLVPVCINGEQFYINNRGERCLPHITARYK